MIVDIDLERVVLGFMLSYPSRQTALTRELIESDFTLPEHKNLFETIHNANHSEFLEADLIYLNTKGYKPTSIFEYQQEFETKTQNRGDSRFWIQRLRDLNLKRNIEKTCNETILDLSGDKHSADILNDLSLKNIETAKLSQVVDTDSNLQIIQELEADMKRARENSGILGIELFGLKKLDNALSGGEHGDFIVIAGRPGMGKSVMAVNMAITAIKTKKRLIIWSLEMTKKQYAQRIIAALGGGVFEDLRKGRIYDSKNYGAAVEKFTGSKVKIIDKSGVTIEQIRSALIAEHEREKIDMVVVDHLGLITAKNMSLYERTTHNSNNSKTLAKDLKLPLVQLCQLNRGVETRGGNKIPMLSDLRESGAIEQDADKVIMIYRPSYYELEGNDQLRIEKNRSGELGLIDCELRVDEMQFKAIEEDTGFPEYSEQEMKPNLLEQTPF